MYHPLYYQAKRCIGRPIYLHHANGRVYHGIVHAVTPNGVYVLYSRPVYGMASASSEDTDQPYADAHVELVYFPGAYFAFGALTGLTLGTLAGAYLW